MKNKSKEELEILLTNSPAVIYTCEYGGNWAGTFMSENIKYLLGYEAKDFIENQDFWVKGIHPDDSERVFANLENLFKNDYHSHEYRFLHKDGNYRWVFDEIRVVRDKDGKPNECIGYWTDITERKHVEEMLRKSRNELRSMYDSITDFITIISPDYKILSANKIVEKWYGQDIIGKVCYKVYQGRNEICPDCPSKKAIETKKSAFSFQPATEVSPSVEIFSFPIFDEEGEVSAVVEHGKDITERKMMEEEKQKLEAQLLHAQKMEAVGQLAGGVAHDFNNILTAIIGYGNIMQMRMNKDDPLRMNLDRILAGADRAAHLTQSLLAFSRKQTIETKPVDLNQIVRRIEQIMLRIIGEDIELRTQLTSRKLIISADSGQIEQVLMNLATNARDTMPDGGRLLIETKQVEIDSEFEKTRGYGEPGQYALLTVSDTGEGIDEETRERIFEPFFTTKEVGKGTGLGLSMTYGIVKQHNGYINVSSKLAEGTTFQIYLPLIQAEVEETVSEELLTPEGGTETILIAEDDENIREFMKEALTAHGYNIIDSYDGEDAINKFIENEENIQLLISDVIMPKKNGKEVYDVIKKIKPDMKALFLSGYAADKIQRKGVLEEGLHFVYKPISLNNLLLKVRELLDK